MSFIPSATAQAVATGIGDDMANLATPITGMQTSIAAGNLAPATLVDGIITSKPAAKAWAKFTIVPSSGGVATLHSSYNCSGVQQTVGQDYLVISISGCANAEYLVQGGGGRAVGGTEYPLILVPDYFSGQINQSFFLLRAYNPLTAGFITWTAAAYTCSFIVYGD